MVLAHRLAVFKQVHRLSVEDDMGASVVVEHEEDEDEAAANTSHREAAVRTQDSRATTLR